MLMLSTASARSIGQFGRGCVDRDRRRACSAGRPIAPRTDRAQCIGMNVARLPFELGKPLGEVDRMLTRSAGDFEHKAGRWKPFREHLARSARDSLSAAGAERRASAAGRLVEFAACRPSAAAPHLLEHPLRAQVHLEPRQREHAERKRNQRICQHRRADAAPVSPSTRERPTLRRSARRGRTSPRATPSGSARASQDPRGCASSCRAANRPQRRSPAPPTDAIATQPTGGSEQNIRAATDEIDSGHDPQTAEL